MLNMQGTSFLESERPAVVAAPRILTPTVTIFLGSTAALSGLELMRQMLTLQPRDQRKVALVYIDTDDPPAPLVRFRRQYNNVFHEFPLRISVPVGISNADRIDETDQHTFIEKKIPQYYANGAGGIRNNGHVAACFNYKDILDVLDRSVVTISRLSTEQNISRVSEIQVNIVAFLGGGTGSGTIVDIAVMVRELLTRYQYKQRINLFCMLPEPINGASLNDISWRKSNATAALLEILAYSRAAAKDPVGGYLKYMRGKTHRLTNDPIANEIYLIGHSSMDDASETARIVGLDLFQRITDASGVGFLEHSKWVDRRTLGATDNYGLPTVFGTSCPLEVRFPVEETAIAFAQVSASFILPMLASYKPTTMAIGENEKREWAQTWNKVARFDASTSSNDPQAVKIETFRQSDFEDVAQSQLDGLWARLERFERATDQRINEAVERKDREETSAINSIPQQDSGSVSSSLIDQRIRHLQRLLQEYTTVLDDMKFKGAPKVPQRPSELEAKLVRQIQLPGILNRLTRDYAIQVCQAYNERLRLHARATRQRLIEQLLKDLKLNAQTAINQSLLWFQDTEAEDRAKGLRSNGIGSMAWQGKLEHPHPHLRHIFDLHTLRTQDGRNVAVERLYRWATSGDRAIEEAKQLDYSSFVDKCAEYLARYTPVQENNDDMWSIYDQIAGRLAERVVDFFKDYYMRQFQDINLVELLGKAAPPPRKGQTRSEQVSDYMLEHLEHIRELMSSLIAFEPQLWADGQSALDTSVYLGIHWHDGSQEELINQTLKNLGSLTQKGQVPVINQSLDPHRLQISYGQHAISINTIPDFYREEGSAMQYYLEYQKAWWDNSISNSRLQYRLDDFLVAWKNSGGNGLMPVHCSGEAQRLVWDKDALGYTRPLPELVIRRPIVTKSGQGQSGPGPGAAIPPAQNGPFDPFDSL
jgi:Tubulin like